MNGAMPKQEPVRHDFSKIRSYMALPNLIDVQRKSYERFLQMNLLPEEREDTGLQSVFTSVFPFSDFRETCSLDFVRFAIGNVHLRDVLGEQLAALSSPELALMALAEQRRTGTYLRSASAHDLRRRCEMKGIGESVDAAEVARLPLCSHLELHLDQLERALRN